MGFEALLGNERLRENLSKSIARGHISHFYLISGPAGAGKRTLARLLAQAILCQGQGRPCGVCGPCRKIANSAHPDFITVDDPEKKFVPVDLVREARADIYIRPNEAEHKIYLFPRAQDMLIPAQNALLKILEEPPSYGVFLLLTDNPEKLLPTVRSRCTELALKPLQPALLEKILNQRFPDAGAEAISAAISRSGGYLGQAQEFLEAGAVLPTQTLDFANSFLKKDTLGLLRVLVPMEKWKRDALIDMLRQWAALLEDALACRSGMAAASPLARELSIQRSPQELLSAIRALQKGVEYAQGNISPAAICGWLEWELR